MGFTQNSTLQQLPGNHDPLDFIGSFIDLSNLGIPKQSFHRIFPGVAITAEHLDRFDGRLHRRI